MTVYELFGGKCCPLCEQTDKVVIETKEFYDEVVEENGSAVLTIECKRCNLSLDDYDRGNEGDYAAARERVVEKWNNLPRWQRVCIKYE